MSHARIKITGHHRGGFRDACDAVSLCEYRGGGGDNQCRGKDCSLAFQNVLVHKLFFFVPSKGWIVLCRAVDTLLLYFGLVVACLFLRTWACPLRVAVPCTAVRVGDVILLFHVRSFFVIIHSRGCRSPRYCPVSRIPFLFVVPRSCSPCPRKQPSPLQACHSSLHRSGVPLSLHKAPSRPVPS